MNLPNKITVSRIILTVIFMLLLFREGPIAKILALSAFSIASFTDLYDGYLARKRNLVTDFGKLMDPIADKILVLAAFLAFVELEIIHAWMVVVIILRELLITGLRVFAAGEGRVIEAERAGKNKTVSQMVAIYFILIYLTLKEIAISYFSFWNQTWDSTLNIVIMILMYTTVVFTLISGFSYVWQNRKILRL